MVNFKFHIMIAMMIASIFPMLSCGDGSSKPAGDESSKPARDDSSRRSRDQGSKKDTTFYCYYLKGAHFLLPDLLSFISDFKKELKKAGKYKLVAVTDKNKSAVEKVILIDYWGRDRPLNIDPVNNMFGPGNKVSVFNIIVHQPGLVLTPGEDRMLLSWVKGYGKMGNIDFVLLNHFCSKVKKIL